ncbi:MAG: ABC transporter ATP-binding protein [Rubrobacter sp.]|nr:ABC transporter ATP-binding protein [Rubrobacter sp.]
MIYVQQFFRPIQLASQVYTQAQASLGGAERIYNVLDEELEPADPPGTAKLGQIEGRIELKDVWFAYEPGYPVLKSVSFFTASQAHGRAGGRHGGWQDHHSQPHPPFLRHHEWICAGGLA